MSQAVFAAYYEAFPESLRIFSDDFKQYVCDLLHMWVTGSRPRLNAFAHWNQNRIMPKQMRLNEDPKVKATRDLTMGNEQGKLISHCALLSISAYSLIIKTPSTL